MQKCDMALFFYLDAFITSGPIDQKFLFVYFLCIRQPKNRSSDLNLKLAHTVLGKDVCTESLVDVVFILLLIERLTELCYY